MADSGEIKQAPAAGHHQQFSRFDIVTNYSDHHYAKQRHSNPDNSFANASSKIHKKIMKEWKILEENLPDTIYVRVYETRIDLMRAAIVGPPGTPYHDGLFFFDLAFPCLDGPPKVHYKSFGLSLNPNLLSTGYVCLSLPNAVLGRNASEEWDPARSTILQVLVSLQGLVLNQNPYYNEERFIGHKKKMLEYNDQVFVLSCRTMMYLLTNPPRNFEQLVAMHFRERASVILTSCHDYMNGRARVGKIDGVSRRSGSVKVSGEFLKEIKPVYDRLLLELPRNGASLTHFFEHLEKKKQQEKLIKEKKFEIGKIFGCCFYQKRSLIKA